MSARDCIEAVTAAAGRELSEGELDRILSETQALMAKRRAAGESARDAAARVGAELAGEVRLEAMLARRAAAENVLIKQSLMARVRPGLEDLARREALTGMEGNKRNQARSAHSEQKAAEAMLTGDLMGGLRRAGLLEVMLGRDKAFDLDVAREMSRIDAPEIVASTGNKHAAEAAGILHRVQETARLMQNEAGAWIGKIGGYITRQSHDVQKIYAAGFDTWAKAIAPRLDDRTFDHLSGPEAVPGFLRETYNSLATGVHQSSLDVGDGIGGGTGNIAKRASQERVLHFKDADNWFAYNQEFGRGNVIDSVIAGLEGAARNIGVMRVFGSNPEAMLQGWTKELTGLARARADLPMVNRLGSKFNENVMDTLLGRANLPGNNTIANIGANFRAVQSMSKLGGALPSSFTDVIANAALLRHNGIGLFDGYANQFKALLPSGPEGRAIADEIGVGFDSMLGRVHSRFHAEDGVQGQMSGLVNKFYRLNGLAYWTDAQKGGVGDILAYNMAKQSGRDFDRLPRRLQTSLRRYGIEAAEWDVVRQGSQKAADGRNYLLPSSVADLPDEAFVGLAGVDGAARARTDLRFKMQAYITNQVEEGMSEATAGGRTMTTWGTKGGTPLGEAIRLFMQFKSFTINYTARTLGREFLRETDLIGGRFGAAPVRNTVRGALANPSGVAHLIGMTSLVGYAVLTLKDFAKGRSPRDPDDAGGYAALVGASMLQGGGLGLFGDFLLGESNRFGGGLLSSMAGPTIGTVEDLDKLFKGMRDGTGKTGAEVFQLAKSNTPFLNLFYARWAMDYYVLWGLQEALNPGYLRRMEQRAKKENNQEFWLRPTQADRTVADVFR